MTTTTTPLPQLVKATLSIGGMTCSSCSNDIQHAVEMQSGVQSCNISSLTNSGTVIFDQNSSSSISDIIRLIEDKGYECTSQSVEPLQEIGKSKEIPDGQRRTIQLAIKATVGQSCLLTITTSLISHFGDEVQVTHVLDNGNPIISVSYKPRWPDLTIRSIIAHIESLNSFYQINPYHPPSAEDKSRIVQLRERRNTLWRLLLAAVIAIPTLLIGVVWMSLVPEDNSIRQWFEQSSWTGNTARATWALFFLATPVYFISASTFHTRAGREIYSLWRRKSKIPILQRFYRFGSMNLLISAGTSIAYWASVVLLIFSATSDQLANSSTYFDSVVFLTFFILIGRYLEAFSKAKAGDAVSMLGQIKPERTLLVMPAEEGEELATVSDTSTIESRRASKATERRESVAVDLLEIGDTVIIPHGSTPPADGILISDKGQFDESSLTGESKVVRKETGDEVFLGTINTGTPIKMTITGIGGSSMLDQIIAVVREGQTKRAPVERIASSITRYFVPVITLLAILTFCIWLGLGQSGVLDPKYIKGHTGGWAFWSLEFAIAVFVVACPCGIGLAAPTALYVGTGLAAKAGILVRGGGEAFQDASNLDAIVFDKTGTLTEGDLRVTASEILNTNNLELEKEVIWNMARLLEECSSHPVAKAITLASVKHSRVNMEASEIVEIPGHGMKGLFKKDFAAGSRSFEAILGSEAFIRSYDPAVLTKNVFAQQLLGEWKTDGKSVAVLALRETNNNSLWQISTVFALSDPIRCDAASTIAAIQARGINTYMLSGDNPETARIVAQSVGIPLTNVFASALPQDKATKIEQLKRDLARPVNRRWFSGSSNDMREAKIAFVGDGINDAPALLASTVSIALSSGSSIALTSSSFILLTPSLESINTLLFLSKKVFRRVKWNFAWAMIYNVVLIPVAAGIFFKAKDGGFILGPVWASAAMALSSLSVVMASLAMRWGL